MLSICAVIAVRNEAHYLPVLLPILAEQGIEVVIIDHGSTDGSRDLYPLFAGNPIISVEDLVYEGVYSQTQQLEAKQRIYQKIKHDWVIHHDADEIFEHHLPGLTLRDAIQEADDGGYNVLNFDEFVFLPEPDADYVRKNYHREMLRYYLFEPMKNRKNAAWKRGMLFDNVSSGGHQLSGDGIKIFPENHVFRHYIVLSYTHALQKYLNRRFSDQDIQRGWHGGRYGNRLNFTAENLTIPESSEYIFKLSAYNSKDFRKDKPSLRHFWLWA